MAASGAVLGYCQALFGRAATPEEHTRKVAARLASIGAPWALSHELFWGYRNGESTSEYLMRGITPLAGTGRVPVVITGLDPALDSRSITDILNVDVAVADGATVLLRLVVRNEASLRAATKLYEDLIRKARSDARMPAWWPLLQGPVSSKQWEQFRRASGPLWQYVNIAVNPFVSEEVLLVVAEQVTVAQVVIGPPGGIHDDVVTIPGDMQITGTTGDTEYSIAEFIQRIQRVPMPPTLILLGPTKNEWSDGENGERIAAALAALRPACDALWRRIPVERRHAVWNLEA